MTVCLNENHWNIYDKNCSKCKSEVQESHLLDDEEYSEWTDGKFTLGFNLKTETIQNHLKSRQTEDHKRSQAVVSKIL